MLNHLECDTPTSEIFLKITQRVEIIKTNKPLKFELQIPSGCGFMTFSVFTVTV